MSNFKTRQMASDEKLEVKVMKAQIGKKEFITPYKSLNTPQTNSILEIYQKIHKRF